MSALLGDSNAMRTLRAGIAKLAPLPTPVLLLGETGTGKTLAACELHRLSPRCARPFAVLDCGALAPSLAESELFGAERGAFTSADARRAGALERAGSGTLLLDEVGELPVSLQPRLLRALGERRFVRLGGGETLVLGARVVAATNVALREAVARGAFRADLFHRLAAPVRLGADDARALLAEIAPAVCARATPPRAASALLADARGNVSAAARALGLPRTTYRRRLARERAALSNHAG